MNDEDLIPLPKSRFLKVKCLDCGNEQIVFGCASTVVKCLICSKVLVIPKGSKAEVKTKILAVLG